MASNLLPILMELHDNIHNALKHSQPGTETNIKLLTMAQELNHIMQIELGEAKKRLMEKKVK